ncbi:hypothetical protein DL96DRAFT_1721440 [Flagelloscypha sp. PMI_526]|nr:hypothetical protein DL96DRAFT_1721440 [Flagelloscypha sp. PMI_526]
MSKFAGESRMQSIAWVLTSDMLAFGIVDLDLIFENFDEHGQHFVARRLLQFRGNSSPGQVAVSESKTRSTTPKVSFSTKPTNVARTNTFRVPPSSPITPAPLRRFIGVQPRTIAVALNVDAAAADIDEEFVESRLAFQTRISNERGLGNAPSTTTIVPPPVCEISAHPALTCSFASYASTGWRTYTPSLKLWSRSVHERDTGTLVAIHPHQTSFYDGLRFSRIRRGDDYTFRFASSKLEPLDHNEDSFVAVGS